MNVKNLRAVLPDTESRRLANGLTVCVVSNREVPIVATALWYRAGTRDERPGHGGTAHFLEHMMFKGSQRFGPGEIDRLTRALGGSNNAFTSHDATVYYFVFAADRWQRALEIEADRMASLTLDEDELNSERQVIVEEIAMYEGEPWDALEMQVIAESFPNHPYGRPVLGTREDLARTDGAVLRAFHERFYRPENAVLVVAGDVDATAFTDVEAALPALTARHSPAATAPAPGGGEGLDRLRRLERRHGEVARFFLSLPSPAATDSDHPELRLLLGVLASGRSSRLHRALVDEGQLAVWVSADVGESVDPGTFSITAEVLPGIDPERVEATVLGQLEELRRNPPDSAELARAKKILYADWIFGHEKVYQQAMLVGSALALFDPEHPWRYFERLLTAETADLPAIAERYLQPAAGGVLGWSLPQEAS